MGTFVDYNGSMEIPEKKREEFLFRVQKIVELGGLMKLKKVSMHGIELFLLRPLELSKDGVAAGVVSLKRLLNQSILKSWSSKMIKKSLEAYFFTLKNKIVFCKKQFQNMSVFCFVSTEIV